MNDRTSGGARAQGKKEPVAHNVFEGSDSGRKSDSYRVALSSENEIALRQAVDFVGINSDSRDAPSEKDVRMVTFLFGNGTHVVHEFQSIREVFEREGFLQVMPIDDAPTFKLGEQWRILLFREWRNAPATRYAFTRSEFDWFRNKGIRGHGNLALFVGPLGSDVNFQRQPAWVYPRMRLSDEARLPGNSDWPVWRPNSQI